MVRPCLTLPNLSGEYLLSRVLSYTCMPTLVRMAYRSYEVKGDFLLRRYARLPVSARHLVPVI
nr:hypothetical protein Q903MT_gene543 [Picea sitchensis]